jgi:XRE family transcriptional regulator, regulator of sulfur utilization
MPHVGVMLKRLRDARGMTQAQLAKRAGLTQGYIAKIESAEYAPDPALSVVLKLARALDVSIGELVAGKKSGKRRRP